MIAVFSGNGNSLHAARLLAERLREDVVELRGGEWKVPGTNEGRVVWVMPVHCWGMPVAVDRFLKSLPDDTFGSGVEHYLVLTCGDDTGLTQDKWRAVIDAHGWLAMGAFSVQMPNTYTLLPGFDVDSPVVTGAKLAAVPSRIEEVAAAIERRAGGDDVVKGAAPRLKSAIWPLFARYDIHPRKFRASDDCISCGKCERVCPLSNITLVEGHPQWGADCTMCLGCYNCCPVRAIDYGRRSRGKGQYFYR